MQKHLITVQEYLDDMGNLYQFVFANPQNLNGLRSYWQSKYPQGYEVSPSLILGAAGYYGILPASFLDPLTGSAGYIPAAQLPAGELPSQGPNPIILPTTSDNTGINGDATNNRAVNNEDAAKEKNSVFLYLFFAIMLFFVLKK